MTEPVLWIIAAAPAALAERVSGLPCAESGEPTSVSVMDILACFGCGYRVERPATDQLTADATRCDLCNP